MTIHQEFIQHLQAVPWFCRCGQASAVEWAVSAPSINAALKSISAAKWENRVLEEKNAVTLQLRRRSIQGHGREYQEWNQLVQEFKQCYMPPLIAQWTAALEPIGLHTKAVMDDLSFNMLVIAVLDAYRELVPVPEFFIRLLTLYKLGFLPCGWKGKAVDGRFIIY